jgi:hypothetical protein
MAPATAEQEHQEQPAAEQPKNGGSKELVRQGVGASIGFGLSARNWDEGFRIAKVLANSEMVPKAYQGKPENIVVAMQHGAEIGLPPMASLQSIAVINGKPGVYGDGFLGVIMSSPAYARHEEHYVLASGDVVKSLSQADLANDETRAVSKFWRKGNPEPFVAEFSIGDAKRAGLWSKEGPWKNYPARQMRWRARGFAGRDAFAAELRGIKSAEELLDAPDDDLLVETVQQAGPPAEPVRRSQKVVDEPASEPAADAPAVEAPRSAPRSAGRSSTSAAARKPDSKSQAGHGPSVTTEHMVITETTYVTPKGQDPYWEIDAEVQKQGQAPVGMIFMTQDEATYKFAASCAGTGALVNITWHGGQRQDGSACKVLESIIAAN